VKDYVPRGNHETLRAKTPHDKDSAHKRTKHVSSLSSQRSKGAERNSSQSRERVVSLRATAQGTPDLSKKNNIMSNYEATAIRLKKASDKTPQTVQQ